MFLDRLTQDLNIALKGGDKVKTETLRYLIAAIKKFDIDTYLPGASERLSDDDVTKIIRRQVKTHEESITAFKTAGRQDLVDKETGELRILKTYLPQELTDDEIRKLVNEVVRSGSTNFGQVMGIVMKKIAGRASGERVVKLVKEELT